MNKQKKKLVKNAVRKFQVRRQGKNSNLENADISHKYLGGIFYFQMSLTVLRALWAKLYVSR